ncbi:uncharacterized protein LOC128218713 isoform X2 [Mya arenaria]|uniref:uncharacterized protein LOC128218713 isoform X2 n=1 Tax=Mya arenaria TaxID=6604 RepID=UPI0022E23356|nr:uncharacterized protein LOC128218713 isoform X2 [Mya arenaria]
MPHTKAIRRFNRPRVGINGPQGRYVIRLSGSDIPEFLTKPDTPERESQRPTTFKIKGNLAPLKPLTTHFRKLRRGARSRGRMKMVNIEFKSMDTDRSDDSKEHLPPFTTTLTFTDYLCKWCLTYVGQRRQFCSADCAAQFKLCQRRRDEKQNLNISVDYYGNVKLSIQGLPIASGEEGLTQRSSGDYAGGRRRGRRRRRCRNCAKRLTEDGEGDFCDETCETMETEREKREEFVNIFQQKEAAERRRIRKWLVDAQDQYTRQTEGAELLLNGERADLEGLDITSGPAALNPLPVHRTPLPNIEPSKSHVKDGLYVTSGPAELNPLPIMRTPLPSIVESKKYKDSLTRSGGPSYSFRRQLVHHPISERFRLPRDEVITGGPVTLNPTPLRKAGARPPRSRDIDHDKRQLRVDLQWIPKFHT